MAASVSSKPCWVSSATAAWEGRALAAGAAVGEALTVGRTFRLWVGSGVPPVAQAASSSAHSAARPACPRGWVNVALVMVTPFRLMLTSPGRAVNQRRGQHNASAIADRGDGDDQTGPRSVRKAWPK